jgi:hypothetical protein
LDVEELFGFLMAGGNGGTVGRVDNPSDFPTNIFHAFVISPTRATCSDNLIFLDLVELLIV